MDEDQDMEVVPAALEVPELLPVVHTDFHLVPESLPWGCLLDSSHRVAGCLGGQAPLAEDGEVEAPQGEEAACCPC